MHVLLRVLGKSVAKDATDVTYLPISSTTGAGHSRNVFSTPAGFSSERRKQYFDKCPFPPERIPLSAFSKGGYTSSGTDNKG